MNRLSPRTIFPLLALAFLGWALCDAIMTIGMQLTTLPTILLIHTLAAPLIFGALSALYFARFHVTGPLVTAVCFTGFVMVMDTMVVALLIQRSFAMFASIEGTWLPFVLIFAATYLVGALMTRTARLRHAVG